MGCSGSKPSGTHSPSHHSSGGGDGLFLLHDADFTGRDDRSSTEGCNSIEEAVALMESGEATQAARLFKQAAAASPSLAHHFKLEPFSAIVEQSLKLLGAPPAHAPARQ